jgi:hypothetical protein
MKKIVLAAGLLTFSVASAAGAPPTGNERVDYWRQKMAQELPAGSSQSAISEWASQNHLKVSERPQTNELVIRLESASAGPPGAAKESACTYYRVTATLKLDAKKSLVSTDVKFAENCF